jgi:hypothetical protein
LDFADVKSTCGDKQYIVRLYSTVFGLNCTPLYDWQNIPLDTFATHLRTIATTNRRNFIYFVDEYNAALFCTPNTFLLNGIVVDELIRFLNHYLRACGFNRHVAAFGLFRHNCTKDIPDINANLHTHRQFDGFDCIRNFQLNHKVIQFSRPIFFLGLLTQQ